jgi:NitT/TauT family transport system ATP-binding protein
MGDVILETRGLGARYRDPDGGWREVFEALDLEVERGEFVSVVGPSGCGKTTLLHVLAGLLEPFAGEVCLHGEPRVGVMFQRPTLVPWRKILGNVCFGAECMGLEVDEDRARALLASMGLEEIAAHYPHQLSEGMKQRVNLARALYVEPALLLLDEPFSALDVVTRRTLQRELLVRCHEQGVAVLHVSHNLEDVVAMADRVLILGGSPCGVVHEQVIDWPAPRARGPRMWAVIEALESAQGVAL